MTYANKNVKYSLQNIVDKAKNPLAVTFHIIKTYLIWMKIEYNKCSGWLENPKRKETN